MNDITAWVPAMLYRTDFGYDCYSMWGEIPTSGNAICDHGTVPTPACRCGFTSLAKKSLAEEEPGMHLIEVTHVRTMLWTDAKIIRALSVDMTKIHLSPECHECFTESYTLTATDLLNSKSDRRVEVACEKHAGDEGLFNPSEVSDYLGVEVVWDAPGRMAAAMAVAEAEEIMAEAEHDFRIESMTKMLTDSDLREQLARRLETEGPMMVIAILGMLHQMPFEVIVENAQFIIELFAGVDDGLLSGINLEGVDVGDNLSFVMTLIKR